jgi:Tfp pilus assembly PilM family ATPase
MTPLQLRESDEGRIYMSTVVYLSNQQIHIVEGVRGKTATVNRYLSFPAPQGSIINGIIMDQETFGSFLKEIWSANKLQTKDVNLVINSSKFVGQNMEIPKMADEKTLEHIKRGFSNIDRSEEKVYGFIRLEGSHKKMKRLYAESVSPDFISDYISFFEGIGIKLKGIYSGEGGMISLVNATAAKNFDTFMIMIADSMTLTTVLYVKKVFTYYNSVRCFHEPGSEDYAQDLTRSASQIKQFMQANQLDSELEVILLAGVEEKDLSFYKTIMKEYGVQTKIDIFSDTKNIKGLDGIFAQKYLFATSGLFNGGNGSNYILRYLSKKTEKKANSNTIYFVAIGATLVVAGIAFLIAFLFARGRRKQLEDLQAYNTSPGTLMQVETYDELTYRNSFLVGQYLSIANINENLDTYPWATKNVREHIFKLSEGYATVTLTSCNSDSGTTDMSVTAENPKVINEFITILMSQKMFHNVTYTGYSYSAENQYRVNVSCTLEESVGREGAEDED